jgi:hypothetical protein
MSSHTETTGQYASEGAGANDLTGDGQDIASGSRRGIKAQISGFAESAKQQAASAVAPIRDNARNLAEEQKQRGASRIDDVAQAVHNAAEELGREFPPAAEYAHAAADKLQSVSRMLRENSVEDLLQKGLDLAEERPLVFTGGAVAMGFLLTRFLRSSAPAYDESDEE